MSNLLLKNASFVALMDDAGTEITNCSIYCENGIIKEVGKEKRSLKIAFIITVAASLELVKRGEVYIKQNEECGEIFLKRK